MIEYKLSSYEKNGGSQAYNGIYPREKMSRESHIKLPERHRVCRREVSNSQCGAGICTPEGGC